MRAKADQSPNTFLDDLSRSIFEFYSDYCWKMTEYWFKWHTIWFQMAQEKSRKA